MGAPAFDPRRAIRSPHPSAPMPGMAPNLQPVHPAARPMGHQPQPYAAPGMAQPHYPNAQTMPYGGGMSPASMGTHGVALSKRDAKRAAKARAKAEKAHAKQQAKATPKTGRSPLIPFILGMFAGGIMTAYLSNALFAPRQLDGPAWTLPNAADVPLSDVPMAEAIPDDQITFDEGEG
ncbi:MAG: hypothetical protein AAF926_06430 [Pseudomonadota bacterium]